MSDDKKSPTKPIGEHPRQRYERERKAKARGPKMINGKKVLDHAMTVIDKEIKKSEEPLIKMPMLNPESSAEIGASVFGYQADHFNGHPQLGKPYHNEGHETHHSTTKLSSGMYHHVYNLSSHVQNMLQGTDTRHILSHHADASLPGVASMHTKTGADGNPQLKRHGYHQVTQSNVHPDHRGQGHGKTLYNLALEYHGKLASGMHVSNKAEKVWNSWSSNNPKVRTKLAPSGTKKPHTAVFKKSEWTNEPMTLAKTMTIGHAAGLENTKTGGAAIEAPLAEVHVTQKPFALKGNAQKLKAKMAKIQAEKELRAKNPKENWDKHLINKVEEIKKALADINLQRSELDESWIFLDDDSLEKANPRYEGELHPDYYHPDPRSRKPWVAKIHPTKKVVMWHANEKQAAEFDRSISTGMHDNMVKHLKEPYLNTYKDYISKLKKDPTRHFIPCEEGGKDVLRVRHIGSLLKYGNVIRSEKHHPVLGHEDSPTLDVTDPNHLIIHRISHSTGYNKGRLVSVKIPLIKPKV